MLKKHQNTFSKLYIFLFLYNSVYDEGHTAQLVLARRCMARRVEARRRPARVAAARGGRGGKAGWPDGVSRRGCGDLRVPNNEYINKR